MSRRGRQIGLLRSRKQSGMVAVVALVALVAGAAMLLFKAVDPVALKQNQSRKTAQALAEAKEALLGWAVSNSDIPGALPYPDGNRDEKFGFDGASDCPPIFTPPDDRHFLGRLPWKTQGGPCLGEPVGMMEVRDGAGEPLWYAVSQKLLRTGSAASQWAEPAVDWSNPYKKEDPKASWITVRDQSGEVISDRVAAVVFAPGAALPDQDRSGSALLAEDVATNYLDSVKIDDVRWYSNADSDLDFIVYADTESDPEAAPTFNDKLVYITADELLTLLEWRVLKEVEDVLTRYRLGCDLRLMLPSDAGTKEKTISKFEQEFESDKQACAVLIVRAPDDSQKWTIAGFSDAGNFRTVVIQAASIDDPDHALWEELKRRPVDEIRIVELATTRLGRTYSVGSYPWLSPFSDPRDETNTFDAVVGTREGHLPLHLPNEQINTAFTVDWQIEGAELSDMENPSTIPDEALQTGVQDATGTCSWTDAYSVDCIGTASELVSLPSGQQVTRTYTFDLHYYGLRKVIPPDEASTRTREVATDGPLPPRTQASILIEDIVESSAGGTASTMGPVTRTLTIDEDTTGAITVSGIRYDLDPDTLCYLRLTVASDSNSVEEMIRQFKLDVETKKDDCAVLIVRSGAGRDEWTIAGYNDGKEFREKVVDDPEDGLPKALKKDPVDRNRILGLATAKLGRTPYRELPAWFVANRWHHLIYVAYAQDGLTIERARSADPNDQPEIVMASAIAIAAGPPLSSQDRSRGHVGEYFESENSSPEDGKFSERKALNATFNDVLRVLNPSP